MLNRRTNASLSPATLVGRWFSRNKQTLQSKKKQKNTWDRWVSIEYNTNAWVGILTLIERSGGRNWQLVSPVAEPYPGGRPWWGRPHSGPSLPYTRLSTPKCLAWQDIYEACRPEKVFDWFMERNSFVVQMLYPYAIIQSLIQIRILLLLPTTILGNWLSGSNNWQKLQKKRT